MQLHYYENEKMKKMYSGIHNMCARHTEAHSAIIFCPNPPQFGNIFFPTRMRTDVDGVDIHRCTYLRV